MNRFEMIETGFDKRLIDEFHNLLQEKPTIAGVIDWLAKPYTTVYGSTKIKETLIAFSTLGFAEIEHSIVGFAEGRLYLTKKEDSVCVVLDVDTTPAIEELSNALPPETEFNIKNLIKEMVISNE